MTGELTHEFRDRPVNHRRPMKSSVGMYRPCTAEQARELRMLGFLVRRRRIRGRRRGAAGDTSHFPQREARHERAEANR